MPDDKPDLSEFFKLSKPKRRPCALGFAREQLKPDEQVQLDAALAVDSGIITAGAIQAWLAVRKHEVSVGAVVSHRKGTCTCQTTE